MKEKKVTFSNQVKLILIPTLDEYYEQQLYHQLWWSYSEINTFKLIYQNQIYIIMWVKDMNLLNAKKLLNS